MRVPGHLSLYGGWEDSGETGSVMATGILRARSMSGVGRWGGGRLQMSLSQSGHRYGMILRSLGGQDHESTTVEYFRKLKRLGWVGRSAEEFLRV